MMAFMLLGTLLFKLPRLLIMANKPNSAQLEPKDPLLNHLTDPWSFTISGVISGKHTLHKILASSPSIPPKKTKRCISALLRR